MNTIPNAGSAVDLDQVKRADQAESNASAAARQQEAISDIRAHDAAMQRIFRGIIPRPQRRRAMVEAMDRMASGYTPRERKYKLRADAPRKRRGPGGGGKSKRSAA